MDWGVNDAIPGSEEPGILVIFEKSSELRFVFGRGQLIFKPARGLLIFEPGRGQSSLRLRDVLRICWVRWNSQLSKNCVSLSSCRKLKVKTS